MSQTPVLQLSSSDLSQVNGPFFWERDRLDNREGYNQNALDKWTGAATSSFSTKFALTGSASDLLGDGGVIGVAYTRSPRVIQEVVAWAVTSGSGGVSTIDVKIQNGSFSSIFLNNNAYKPAISSSLGNYGLAKVGTGNMVSGSNTIWAAGTLLRAELSTAAGAAGVSGQKGITVEIFWKPTGSYGTAQ